jgi:hypothetical protein
MFREEKNLFCGEEVFCFSVSVLLTVLRIQQAPEECMPISKINWPNLANVGIDFTPGFREFPMHCPAPFTGFNICFISFH